MGFSFEKSEVITEEQPVIPEISGKTAASEGGGLQPSELLEMLISSEINGDI